jgi:TRAP-type C4-dicarboxylate transport system permease small subunit
LGNYIGRIAIALGAVSSAGLVFLMLLTFGDVIGRYFFNAPITFTVEITELLMGLVILLGLGLTTLRSGHIAVDIVSRTLPKPLLRYQAIFSRTCMVFFLTIITWQLFEQTILTYNDGLYTQVIGIYVYPFAAVMALAAGFSCLIAAMVLGRALTGADDGSS